MILVIERLTQRKKLYKKVRGTIYRPELIQDLSSRINMGFIVQN